MGYRIKLKPPRRRRGTIEDGGGGIIPDRLRWFRKICRFYLLCTPISLTAQRNGGVTLAVSVFLLRHTPCIKPTAAPVNASLYRPQDALRRLCCQRNAFQPLQFAPARRGKVHYFRNTALRYSSAVRLPLLFPKKSFGFFGDPIFPLHKGTKTLHHKNGGSDSRPPSFRPTAVFILHLPPGCFWLVLVGWDYNPSVICFANATSLCTREAALRVACNPSSVFAASGESTFCSAADGRPLCLLRRHLP